MLEYLLYPNSFFFSICPEYAQNIRSNLPTAVQTLLGGSPHRGRIATNSERMPSENEGSRIYM